MRRTRKKNAKKKIPKKAVGRGQNFSRGRARLRKTVEPRLLFTWLFSVPRSRRGNFCQGGELAARPPSPASLPAPPQFCVAGFTPTADPLPSSSFSLRACCACRKGDGWHSRAFSGLHEYYFSTIENHPISTRSSKVVTTTSSRLSWHS